LYNFFTLIKRAIHQLIHFFLIPIAVGVLGGFSAVLFRKMIDANRWLFFTISSGNKLHYPLLLPFVYLFSHWVAKKLLISPENVTVDEIAKKISLERGGFSPKKGLLVLGLTSMNIGFGAPVGREGPIAKLGGVLSEIFVKALRINRVNGPIYLTCGVSSAIAATFNAPVAAVLFGIEIILGKVNNYILIPLIVSSGTATLIAREFIGNFPAFFVPHLVYTEREVPFFPLLAAFAAAVTIVTTVFLKNLQRIRYALRHVWSRWVFLAGLTVGTILYFYPQAAGVGYGSITELFLEKYSVGEAGEIAIAKLAAVLISFGSGLFGGFMAPSIFVGAFGGYFIGGSLGFDPRVFGLVGSAAVLAGVSGAPFRSALVIIELTHSYQLIVPILFTAALTNYLLNAAREIQFFKRSLFVKGIDVEKLLEKELKVNLNKHLLPVKPVYENAHVEHIKDRFLKEKERYLPVVNNPTERILTGIVSIRDLRLALLYDGKEVRVKDVMTPDPFAVTLSTPLDEILKAIALLEVNRVPITDKKGRYLGMLDVDGLMKELTLNHH